MNKHNRKSVGKQIANAEIARALDQLADLLELQNDNPFRVRAYRNAARSIANETRSVAERIAEGFDPDDLPGVGEGIAARIQTLVETGHLPDLDTANRKWPASLIDLLQVPNLGPKRVRSLYQALNITTLAELKKAVDDGHVADLPGFGSKLATKIGDAIQHVEEATRRFRLADAESLAAPLMEFLQRLTGVSRAEIAGSLRRRKETVGDLDIVLEARDPHETLARVVQYSGIRDVASRGPTRATVHLAMGLQVDIRVISSPSFGAALYYFTGSKAHNVAVRKIAQAMGLKLNEYGLYRGTHRIAGKSEAEVATALGIEWIPPELREDSGEIEMARQHRLPKLITVDGLRGDLHAHTRESDGHDSLEAMAAAAQRLGYQYLAITDHTQSTRIASGLNAARLLGQIQAIDRLNQQFDGFRLLKSAETDILRDGSLDLPDSILKKLDFVLATIHSDFGLSESEQTRRLLKAFDNPLVKGLAHPTCRLIGERPPIKFDQDSVFRAAAAREIFLEVNSQPARLDLNDQLCRHAVQLGVALAISSDAHSVADLAKVRYGVDQARRGWVEAEHVVNTQSLSHLQRALRNGERA